MDLIYSSLFKIFIVFLYNLDLIKFLILILKSLSLKIDLLFLFLKTDLLSLLILLIFLKL